MTKSNQSSLDIADHLSRGEYDWCPEAETRLREQHDKLRLQQAEIDNLTSIKYVNGVTISKLYAEIEALKAPKIPLLEQEIRFILGNGQCWTGEDCSMPNLMYIIRAVEAAHGIGV